LNTAAASDHEIAVLEHINRSGGSTQTVVRQRDLARLAGISLGMTNSILKRLAQKGWVTIRRINSRNIQYAISTAGMEEIARRSYRFLRRTFRDIAAYKETIHGLVKDAARRGSRRVLLVGRSDIEFIIEHCAATEGLAFIKDGDPGMSGTLVFLGEEIDPRSCAADARGAIPLKNLRVEAVPR
jgi:DNA-binding MarR family transcriptional regulator